MSWLGWISTLDFEDLAKTTQVPLFVGKGCGEKGGDKLESQCLADHPPAKTKHVHVVVVDALSRRIRIVANACPDSTHRVGRDAGPHPTSADEDPTLGSALLKCSAQRPGVIGIIDRRSVMGATIDDFVARRANAENDRLFQRKAGVIAGDGNAHDLPDHRALWSVFAGRGQRRQGAV